MINATKRGLLLLALLSLPLQLYGAPPQFEIDLKELDRKPPAASKAEKKRPAKKKRPARPAARGVKPAPERKGEYVRYTVRPGDHIFKILMVHFGMSNDAAERLVPEVVRINRIANIKTLAVGRTLLIPVQGGQESPTRPARKEKGSGRKESAAAEAPQPSKWVAPKPADPERAAAPAPAPKAAAPAPKAAAPAPKVPQAPAEPAAPAPAAVAKPAPPAVPKPVTWVCAVSGRDTEKAVDSLLNAISASWSRNRIVQSDKGAPMAFSIRVDRYFEYKGARYIISIGESDPYNYTLIRLLETAGYRVLRLTGRENFGTVAGKLFELVGVAPELGTHPLSEASGAYGYLLRQDDAGGRQVLVVDGPAATGHKWLLAPGCGAR